MNTHPRYRDRHGRLWEDREGFPMLIGPAGPLETDYCTMLAIHHAYGPLVPVDAEQVPEDVADSDKVLQIVADHIHRDTTYGGLDWDDLIEDLRRAGYTLPDPTEHPKEN